MMESRCLNYLCYILIYVKVHSPYWSPLKLIGPKASMDSNINRKSTAQKFELLPSLLRNAGLSCRSELDSRRSTNLVV